MLCVIHLFIVLKFTHYHLFGVDPVALDSLIVKLDVGNVVLHVCDLGFVRVSSCLLEHL